MIRYLQNVPHSSPQLRNLRLQLIQGYIQQQAEVIATEQVSKFSNQLAEELVQYLHKYIQEHIVLAIHRYIGAIFSTGEVPAVSTAPTVNQSYNGSSASALQSLLPMLGMQTGIVPAGETGTAVGVTTLGVLPS
uniref:ATP-dependent helicase/deoxyribonuclease subunit B n=1 Tax=Lygus hesperus TaxID=30085 RepID=A0A0A9YQ15_LYGHE